MKKRVIIENRPKKVSLQKNESRDARDKMPPSKKTIARVGLAHGAGKVAGETDPIRALLVVIASSDGFAQAQRTPSQKSLRDFSPPSPMAALQL